MAGWLPRLQEKITNLMISADEDASRLILCMLCQKQLCNQTPLTVLACSHVTHTQCLWNYSQSRGQEVIEETTGTHDFKTKATLKQLPCPVCRDNTRLPPEGNIDLLTNKLPSHHLINNIKAKTIVKSLTPKEMLKLGLSEPEEFTNIEFLPENEEEDRCTDRCETDESKIPQGTHYNIPPYNPQVSNENNITLKTTDDNETSHSKTSNNATEFSKKSGADRKSEFAVNTHMCCRTHSKAPCLLYCESCGLPICEKCSFRDHKDHLIHVSKQIAQEWSTELKQQHKTLNAALQTQKLWNTQLEVLQQLQRELYEQMKRTVERQTDVAIQAILAQKNSFLEHLKNHHTTQRENFERGRNFIPYLIQSSIDLQHTINRIFLAKDSKQSSSSGSKQSSSEPYANGSNNSFSTTDVPGLKNPEAMLLVNFKAFESRLKTHIEEAQYGQKYIDQLKKELRFTAKDHIMEGVKSRELRLGQLDFQTIQLNQGKTNSNPSYEGMVAPIPPILLDQNCKNLNPHPTVLWSNVDPTSAISVGGVCYTSAYGLLFQKHDDSLLVAYQNLNTIVKYRCGSKDPMFYPRDKNDVNLATEQLMPYCMAKFDDNTFIITDSRKLTLRIFYNDGVQLNKLADEFLRPYGKFTTEQPEGFSPTSPQGLCTLPNNKVAVSDTIHNTVYIIDPQTETITAKFGEKGSGKYHFNLPNFLTFDSHRQRILVSDRNNHIVKVYDTNGTFVSEFGHASKYSRPITYPDGTQVDEFDGLHEPAGVVCDPKGDILVSNSACHNICRFDGNSGKFLSVVSLYEGSRKLLLSWPYGIDIGYHGELGVTEKGSGRVVVVKAYS